MNENLILVLVAIAIVIGFYQYWRYYEKSGLQALEKWALKNGYSILNSEIRNYKTGPFFLSRMSRLQRIFYVTVQDKSGKQSNAYVKIGSSIFGLLLSEVDVKWEETKV